MPKEQENSLQSQAYQYIRQKIATCEYAPNQMLSESQLRDELGISRTPVREAVSRLVQEGLLTVFPKRGIVVSGISIGDVHKIFEVRSLLEPYTLRTYHNNISLEAMKEFSDSFHNHALPCEDTCLQDFYQLDDAFHALIMRSLENDYLQELSARIQTQNFRLRILSGKTIDSRIRDTMIEHAQIADACLNGEWEQAATAMEIHLIHSRNSALSMLLKQSSIAGIL